MWGIIDIGSNTVRLVVYSVQDGAIVPMLNKKYPAGLAAYIEKDGTLNRDGADKLIKILSELKNILSYIKVKEVFPFATASLRHCANSEQILAEIKEKCSFDVRILTGQEEAVFDYYGVIKENHTDSGIVVDVGGGSTELVFFKNGQIINAVSLALGSLNSFNLFVSKLIPTKKEATILRNEIRRQLEDIGILPKDWENLTIYSVGGTARASLKLMKNVQSKTKYTYEDVKELVSYGIDKPYEFIKDVLSVAPERIHTIMTGSIIFKTIAKFYKINNFTISRCGVREGYLMHILKEKGEI